MAIVAAVALVARLAVVAWAGNAIPPTADGHYYDVVARRIAEGHGYTWLWPDGAVTYAAHYPIGYPGFVALIYTLFGAKPVAAMIGNALVGTAGVVAAYDLVARAASRRLALAAGLVVAVHPALVPYTAALMTEGMTASLLVLASAATARARDARSDKARWGWLVATGVTMGFVTLVRPQSLALAPVLGWLALGASRGSAEASGRPAVDPRGALGLRALGAAVVMVLAILTCAPWTARNCVRMQRCSLVSVNGGWNLAIGTETVDGAWREITVPPACKEVFAEAAKDACFGHAAVETILAHPAAWLARVPAKVGVTFDYFGAAPWYLHQANPAKFPYQAKVTLGVIETVAARLLLIGALVAVMRLPGPRRRARVVLSAVGLVTCVVASGVIGYIACAIAIGLLGRRELERQPVIVPITAAVILATAATHAVFFGAGRYGLVVVPFVTVLAFVRLPKATTTSVGSATSGEPTRVS